MEDLLWKKKSTKYFRYIMLFFIRLAEVITASCIPSTIGLIIVLFTPKDRVMQIMEFLAFFVFLGASCTFWIRYVKHRPKKSEFYILNGLSYLIYVSLSVTAYLLSDVYLYSIFFSDLRIFEVFGVSTLNSLIYTHIMLIFAMIVSETLAHIHYERKRKLAIENGADEVEIDSVEVTPKKDNRKVELLSVDEVNKELEREIREAEEMLRRERNTANKSDIKKGDGTAVTETVPADPENDIDDDDYVSEAYARKEMKVTENYSTEKLWNAEIYNGCGPKYDYDDEDYTKEVFGGTDNGSIWNTDIYKGNGELPDYGEDFDEDFGYNCLTLDYEKELATYTPNDLDDYDSDNLWGSIKQGRDKK